MSEVIPVSIMGEENRFLQVYKNGLDAPLFRKRRWDIELLKENSIFRIVEWVMERYWPEDFFHRYLYYNGFNMETERIGLIFKIKW
jgi:hypothetical protein